MPRLDWHLVLNTAVAVVVVELVGKVTGWW